MYAEDCACMQTTLYVYLYKSMVRWDWGSCACHCWCLQEAEWVENICTSVCILTIIMSIIVGKQVCCTAALHSPPPPTIATTVAIIHTTTIHTPQFILQPVGQPVGECLTVCTHATHCQLRAL